MRDLATIVLAHFEIGCKNLLSIVFGHDKVMR